MKASIWVENPDAQRKRRSYPLDVTVMGFLCFVLAGMHHQPLLDLSNEEPQLPCRDPKDGELWLVRMKPGETLVEVRSDADVQIVRLNWL